MLQPLTLAHLPRVKAWKNDPALAHMIAALTGPFSDADVADWLARNGSDPCQWLRGIFRPGQDEPLGVARLMFIDRVNAVAELGMYLGAAQARGQGLGRAVVHALLAHGFGPLSLERIHLRVLEDNVAAIRCYEASGFRHEGRWRAHVRGPAGRLDMLLMGILRREFVATSLEARP
ncbi:MAG: GNAT family N-acetyltransferase [Burkholderiales bacterium]|nr:GNAT family N-acetyltransferase [Burkholderiales bacterium]